MVNAAAGAVGSVVGQLAKIKVSFIKKWIINIKIKRNSIFFQGCTVIAFVGCDKKLDWCKDELGFDFVFNYKKIYFSDALDQVAPDGVEMFFDNVEKINLNNN